MDQKGNLSKKLEKYVLILPFALEGNLFISSNLLLQMTFDNVFRPLRIKRLAGVEIISVSCGNKHSCAMDTEGMLWTWGFGGYGMSAGDCLLHFLLGIFLLISTDTMNISSDHHVYHRY